MSSQQTTMANKPEEIAILFEGIKDDLLDYTNQRIKLLKLDSFERIGLSSSILGYHLILALILASFLFFSFFGLAFFIGELLDSQAAGFAILALFSILVFVILLLNGKRIKRSILNRTLSHLQKVDRNEE